MHGGHTIPMKILIAILLSIGLGVLLWQGIMIGSAIRSCAANHQEELALARTQIESIRGDHVQYCSTSYDILASWDACVSAAPMQTSTPKFIVLRLKPVVTQVLAIIGDPNSMVNQLKLEHDDLCKDQIYLIFYPPQQDK